MNQNVSKFSNISSKIFWRLWEFFFRACFYDSTKYSSNKNYAYVPIEPFKYSDYNLREIWWFFLNQGASNLYFLKNKNILTYAFKCLIFWTPCVIKYTFYYTNDLVLSIVKTFISIHCPKNVFLSLKNIQTFYFILLGCPKITRFLIFLITFFIIYLWKK